MWVKNLQQHASLAPPPAKLQIMNQQPSGMRDTTLFYGKRKKDKPAPLKMIGSQLAVLVLLFWPPNNGG
jgi:hypothetical protein